MKPGAARGFGFRGTFCTVYAAMFLCLPQQAVAKRFNNFYGDRIELSYKPASGIIWSGFSSDGELEGRRLQRAVSDSLVQIAETVRNLSRERFAVTGLYCIRTAKYFGVTAKMSCKLQAVSLNSGETVVPGKGDDQPQYFVAADVLANSLNIDWFYQMDARSGIRSTVDFSTAR